MKLGNGNNDDNNDNNNNKEVTIIKQGRTNISPTITIYYLYIQTTTAKIQVKELLRTCSSDSTKLNTATVLPRLTAIEGCCSRCSWDFGSEVVQKSHWPNSLKNVCASGQIWTKWYLDSRLWYFEHQAC